MSEIKVNDYIRTDEGIIGKIKRIELDKNDASLKWYVFDKKRPDINIIDEVYINKPYIKNNKEKPIDLIEESDILKYQIYKLSPAKIGEVKKYKDARSFKEYLGVEGFNLNQITILEILTKEQFEKESYKVGE